MRILGFSKKWDKLKQDEFTTFRYPRGDYDWYVEELVKVVFQPRRKGGGEILGVAEIINKERREFDEEYYKMVQDGVPLITDAEAIADGFADKDDMVSWLRKTYGRLDWMPRMNKLTLRKIGDWESWKRRSERSEVCGILGCTNTPVIKCPYCGNHYCEEHKGMHFHQADKYPAEKT